MFEHGSQFDERHNSGRDREHARRNCQHRYTGFGAQFGTGVNHALHQRDLCRSDALDLSRRHTQ